MEGFSNEFKSGCLPSCHRSLGLGHWISSRPDQLSRPQPYFQVTAFFSVPTRSAGGASRIGPRRSAAGGPHYDTV